MYIIESVAPMLFAAGAYISIRKNSIYHPDSLKVDYDKVQRHNRKMRWLNLGLLVSIVLVFFYAQADLFWGLAVNSEEALSFASLLGCAMLVVWSIVHWIQRQQLSHFWFNNDENQIPFVRLPFGISKGKRKAKKK
jgi:hypothetical protein